MTRRSWPRWTQVLLASSVAVLLGFPAPWLRAEEPPPPRLYLDGQYLRLTALPPILQLEEVERQLGSGLTTSFVVRLRGREVIDGQRLEGESLVEVRYELWDEVYLVAATQVNGQRQDARLASMAELVTWWHELELTLAVLPARNPGPDGENPWRLQVELHVLPFSRAEQQDTQRWFRDSLDSPGQGAASGLTEVDQEQRPLNTVLNLLMASSIGRRELLEYRWQLRLEQPTRHQAAARSPP